MGTKLVDVNQRVNDCKSLPELLRLFRELSPADDSTLQLFTTKRNQLENRNIQIGIGNTNKASSNGAQK
jgi:hypothetical protein